MIWPFYGFIITLLAETSKNSYLLEFCAQVSKTVLLANFNVLQLVRIVWAKISSKLIFPRVLYTSIINHVLSWFDRFTTYYILYEQKCHETHISAKFMCTSITNRVSSADLTVLRLIRTVWAKMSQKSYLREFYATTITNRVLSWFDRFTAYYNCMSENITKLISPRVLFTSVTSRVLSWFDRFRAFHNCMNKNIIKLISPRVLCTSIKNRVPSWFDRFTAY